MRYDGHGRQSRWIFPSKTSPGVADASDQRGAGSAGFTTIFYYDPVQRPSAIINDLPVAGADLSIGLTYKVIRGPII